MQLFQTNSPYTVEFRLMGLEVAGSEYFSQSSELKSGGAIFPT